MATLNRLQGLAFEDSIEFKYLEPDEGLKFLSIT